MTNINTEGATTRRLLSLQSAARSLSLSYWKLRRMVLNGEMPFVRVGRRILIDRQDLDRWIEEHKERWS